MTGSGGAVGAWRRPVARRLAHPVARRVEHRGADGFSLIEILICVVLVGTVLLALAGGMLTLVRTSAATSERQQIQLSLGSYTESLKASPYLPCGGPVQPSTTTYQPVYDAWPEHWSPVKPGMTAQIVEVEFWDDVAGTEGGFVPACPGMDQGTQRITVEIDWRDRTGTAQVVKSYRPAAGP
ncbi:MAG: type IV pilus modification PilV family protein [Microthrixaceae bacterium]